MSNRTSKANDAVSKAWDRELELVRQGKGTRDWTPEQQRCILDYGKAFDENGDAFQGHHMKSVERYPEDQGEPGNIQFLSRAEHKAAHGGSFRNPTNGYYDPVSGVTASFGDGPFVPCRVIELSNPIFRANGAREAGANSNVEKQSYQSSNNQSKGAGNMPAKVTPEAVAALKNTSSQLQEQAETIRQETEAMKSVFDENQEGLGYHSASIQAVIEAVEQTEKEADAPMKKLSIKLLRAAVIRQAHIDNDRYH